MAAATVRANIGAHLSTGPSALSALPFAALLVLNAQPLVLCSLRVTRPNGSPKPGKA